MCMRQHKTKAFDLLLPCTICRNMALRVVMA